jgi:hypothetical protein
LKIATVLQGKTVVVTVEYIPEPKFRDDFNKAIEPAVAMSHGVLEMLTSHMQPQDLALGISLYLAKNSQFPRGTFDRKPSDVRAGRPWPPSERVSWMAELLPYLGYEGLYSQIKFQRSWKDPENVIPAVTLIPPFLDGNSPPTVWHRRQPGMPFEAAATHYVGIAGIGLDAAEYPAGNPLYAKKLGIFGYDRITRLSDITDGTSNTILMAQVPYEARNPWIAGGGSTIRGVPETKSVQPFVSKLPDGRRGTYVIMADGSVRFVSENISDEVFKAMCTIKGGEKDLKLDKDAPLVSPPEGPAPAKPKAPAPPAKAEATPAPAPTKGS